MKFTLLAAALCAQLVSAFILKKQPLPAKPCPGLPLPCGGPLKGKCDPGAGQCVCSKAFGGPDCSQEMADWLEVTASDFVDKALPTHRDPVTGKEEVQHDMLGRYKLTTMFLYKPPAALAAATPPGSAAPIRFVHFDAVAGGWAVSKIGSTCAKDTCFFAYAPASPELPVQRGYQYGSSVKHMYNQPMIQAKDNYTIALSFTPDPQVADSAGLSEFNGEYELVPRYTHVSGKYSIFPVDFISPNRNWVATGLLGDPTKRTVLLRAPNPMDQRSSAPLVGWKPEPIAGAGKDGTFLFTVSETCANHINDLTCLSLHSTCSAKHSDGKWVRECCRHTCSTCSSKSRLSCTLPFSPNLGPHFF